MTTWKTRLAFLILLIVGMIASFAMGQGAERTKLRPQTDAFAVYNTSGVNGKWVKGCTNPPDRCNLGVGNLGDKYTYHWVD
jgi:hypothetical protein